MQFCDDPKKYPQNLHTPKNIHFSETQKNMEIQILNAKNGPSLRMYDNIRVPPSPTPSPLSVTRCHFVGFLYVTAQISYRDDFDVALDFTGCGSTWYKSVPRIIRRHGIIFLRGCRCRRRCYGGGSVEICPL